MFVDGTFRSQLVAQEHELLELRDAHKDLKHQLRRREKVDKEVSGLKSIISSQDDQVTNEFNKISASWEFTVCCIRLLSCEQNLRKREL